MTSGDTPRARVIQTQQGLDSFMEQLKKSDGVVVDVETSQLEEFREDSLLYSVSFLTWSSQAGVEVWTIPLDFHTSPFRGRTREVLGQLAGARWPRKVVAHNGKFDQRWLAEFGLTLTLTFDTMLAASLLDENRPKGLKYLCENLLGAKPWAVDTRALESLSLTELLRYNSLDVWWTYQLYLKLRDELAGEPESRRIFQKVLMPASNYLVSIERRGVFMPRGKLEEATRVTEWALDEVQEKIDQLVPPVDQWPEELAKAERRANLKGETTKKLSANNWLRWLLFEHLGWEVLERGKPNKRWPEGPPSTKESVMVRLSDSHPEAHHLIEASKLQKVMSGFLVPYKTQIDSSSRIHTSFKLAGTVTGRLSSGSIEGKLSSRPSRNAGVNFQQVPRNPLVRGLFSVPEGHWWLESDLSQAELRIAAVMAKEMHMLQIYRDGGDIHTTTAQRLTGRSEVTKEERKKAKAVNFGFLYGMGARKFQDYAKTNYGVDVSEREAQEFRRAFFELFPQLEDWHEKQRRLVHRHGQVVSRIGRIRHLPDVHSWDEEKIAQAERQAINSPVQSLASDLVLIAFVRICQEIDRLGLQSKPLGLVHDAICLEVPDEELTQVARLVKSSMEAPPFGVELGVPIVADLKIGHFWGDDLTDELRRQGRL